MRQRLLVALACAAGAMACAWLYLSHAERKAAGGRTVSILVAAKELAAGTRVTAADLAVRAVPESYLHPETVQATDEDEKKILGRQIIVKLGQGQPLLWSDFESQKSKLGKSLSGLVQKGQRAITLPVDVAGSFANQVRPGDRVDILGTFTRPTADVTVTVLQNVLVVSIAGKREEVDGEPTTVVTAVTLSLELDEAELLVFAMQHGSIHLVLHGDEDIDVVADVGTKSFADLLEDQRRSTLAARRSKKRIRELHPDRAEVP